MRGPDEAMRRSAVPAGVGSAVRDERVRMGWSQDRLARKVGVSRFTIMRLESGRHVPNSHLVQALEEVLEPRRRLVPAWPEAPSASDPCYGPRIRRLRRRLGVTAANAAAAVGVSPATFSRFERGARIKTIVGGAGVAREGVGSDELAKLLGFDDIAKLTAYCMT